MRFFFTVILCISFIFFSCNAYKNSTFSIMSVDNNVCKRLNGKVILYAIFVDTKTTHPWTTYDLQSTLDSIYKAKQWIEKQAQENGIPLSIEIKYHQKGKTIPVIQNLPDKTLSESLYNPNVYFGVQRTDRWADRVATIAGQSLPKDTSSVVAAANKVTNRERLIARLRDIYKTDNIALLYFINNYYKEEISVAIHSDSYKEIEYGIVSFKSPTVIAHEFLHLFGAWDLYISPFSKKRKAYIKKEVAEKVFPNEIMAFTYRSIDSLNLSPFTKYLIGWNNDMDEKYRQMFGNKVKFIKY